MIASLVLAQDQRERIARQARDAFPRECCGLIEGRREGAHAIAMALHPMRNNAVDDDRFEIDPAAHIALSRSLRGTNHAVIGCYHSHPNGHAAPSARDIANEDGLIWLIAALDTHGMLALAAHRPDAGVWHDLRLETPEAVA